MILRIKKKQLLARSPPAVPAGTPTAGLSCSPRLRPAPRRPAPRGAGRRNSGGAPESRREDAFSPSHGKRDPDPGSSPGRRRAPSTLRTACRKMLQNLGTDSFGVGVCLGFFVCLLFFPRFLSRRYVCAFVFISPLFHVRRPRSLHGPPESLLAGRGRGAGEDGEAPRGGGETRRRPGPPLAPPRSDAGSHVMAPSL